MPSTTDPTARLLPYVQELMDNDYARENINEGMAKLRAAYERSQKRRVKAARDEKLRRQLSTAAASIVEGGRALSSGRRKPEKRRGRLMPGLALGVGIGAGVALASSPKLRDRLFSTGSSSDSEFSPSQAPG